MAEETTVTEGLPNAETPQEGTVQEPEATPEGTTNEQSEEVQLPSDVDSFELPEKFKGKSAEEIAKAYVELERMKKVSTENPPTEETPPQEPPKEGGEEDIDSTQLFQEFNEKGDLSEETYKKLEEKGYKREEVKDRLEFEQYKQKKAIDELVEPIGGIEEYTKMSDWFNTTAPEEEKASFMKELEAAGPLARRALIKDLYAKYQSVEASDGTIHTNEPQYKPTKGYASQHELQKDLSDKRYGIDRSYTSAVEEKMAISDLSKL